MVSKYFVLSCVLLQGLASASENSQVTVKKSNDNLRNSQGALSKSQELPRSPRPSRAAAILYASPCSNRLYNPRNDMIPLDRWHADCP